MTPTQIGECAWMYENVAETDIGDTRVPLHLIVEVMDARESIGGEFSEPFTVDASLQPDESVLSEEIKESATSTCGATIEEFEPYMLSQYGFRVPVNTEDTSLGGSTTASEDFEMTVKGHNPCFVYEDDALDYVKNYIPKFLSSFAVESCLQRSINRRGTSGYEAIEEIIDS
jgi:hypothetical protein